MSIISNNIFFTFPVIDLGNIVLRELTESDADNYLNYMSNPQMKEFVTMNNIPHSKDQAIQELLYWSSLFKNKRSIYWGIELSENNQLIGTAGFNIISENNARADISYDLDPKFWGKGLMLKSIKAITHFADNFIRLVRIQAFVIQDNYRSINVLGRCGFYNEGSLKKYEVVDGEHKDYYIYARVII